MNIEKKQNDCGCEDGTCCPPKKKNPWSGLLLAILVLVAVTIIILKFTSKEKNDNSCQPTKDSTQTASKDTTAKPCCPGGTSNCSNKKEH